MSMTRMPISSHTLSVSAFMREAATDLSTCFYPCKRWCVQSSRLRGIQQAGPCAYARRIFRNRTSSRFSAIIM